jgi:hypothetical protein
MMTVMVPDLVPPSEEIRGLCVTVALDLHEVRKLLLSAAAKPNLEPLIAEFPPSAELIRTASGGGRPPADS